MRLAAGLRPDPLGSYSAPPDLNRRQTRLTSKYSAKDIRTVILLVHLMFDTTYKHRKVSCDT